MSTIIGFIPTKASKKEVKENKPAKEASKKEVKENKPADDSKVVENKDIKADE